MYSRLAVLLVLACASAQDFSGLKPMSIEIDTIDDSSERNDSSKPNFHSGINLSGRIINGLPATAGQFPYQAIVSMDNAYLCGGSLISSVYVLTAAHCASGFTNFVIKFGSIYLRASQSGQQIRTTRNKIVHENYNSFYITNDIALLKVDPLSYTRTIAPVQLPRRSDASKTFENQLAVISGFGKTASGAISETLQYAGVYVISNAKCRNYFGSYVTSSNICTVGVNNQGTCNGDSGGPLVYSESGKSTEIGIVSYGNVGCIGAPSAYTRVTSYLDWIAQKTGIPVRTP